MTCLYSQCSSQYFSEYSIYVGQCGIFKYYSDLLEIKLFFSNISSVLFPKLLYLVRVMLIIIARKYFADLGNLGCFILKLQSYNINENLSTDLEPITMTHNLSSATILNPQSFLQSIEQFSFQEKYFKWQSYLASLKLASSQYYQASLQKFVQYYPFNHTYWSELLDLMLKMPKGKANTLKMYQIALAKNPRCITLWRKYIDWLKKQLSNSDPNYMKNQIENASKIVGNHYKAGFVFQYFAELETNPEKKYHMFKKAMVSPIQDLEQIKQLFQNFLDSPEISQILPQIGQQQSLTQTEPTTLLASLKSYINSLYEPTRMHLDARRPFQQKITSDEYIPYTDSIQNWRQYIGFIKQSGNAEFLPSVYERALINQCDNEGLWEQYFLLLENEGNYQRALYLLRFHSLFFRSMSKQLTYYWLEIEQRDNPATCRELYLQLQHPTPDLQLFLRHIQLELRSKQFANAKSLYQAILTVFTTNLQIVTYTVLQYADFSVRYFRDIWFAKKLLQNYFKNYPFEQKLFIGLLEFYEKNVQYKEGSKEAKQVADEFIEQVLQGLKKCYESNSKKQYQRVKKVANLHLRSYITSIYLIKGAERKIKQQEFALKKQEQYEQKIQNKRIHGDEIQGVYQQQNTPSKKLRMQ